MADIVLCVYPGIFHRGPLKPVRGNWEKEIFVILQEKLISDYFKSFVHRKHLNPFNQFTGFSFLQRRWDFKAYI